MQGAALLSKQVTQQAYALAYNESFLLTSYRSFATLACLLFHVAWRNRERLLTPKRPMPAVA